MKVLLIAAIATYTLIEGFFYLFIFTFPQMSKLYMHAFII